MISKNSKRILFELTLCTKDNYRPTIMGLEDGSNCNLKILVININLSKFIVCKNGPSIINTSQYCIFYLTILYFCKSGIFLGFLSLVCINILMRR